MSIESLMPSSHLILCHTLIFLPSTFPSSRVFPIELSLLIRWPKCWSFSFSISPSKEYSGLISFKLTGLISLLSKGFLRVFSSTHSSKASILWCFTFFIIQLSYLYIYIGTSLVAQLVKNLPTMQETLVWFLLRKIPWRRDRLPTTPVFLSFLVVQMVKNLLAMWETWVPSLGWEDPLEEDMTTHSIFLPGESPRTVASHGPHGVAKSIWTWLSD